ncbi:MAG: glycine-rich protein [Candidatus Cybelea sp.]
MRVSGLSRYALCTCVAAILAGCTAQSLTGAQGAIIPDAVSKTKTFSYTGHKQTFTVPPGVTTIKIIALGASGGASTGGYGTRGVGGNGGRVKATIPVASDEKLAVFVGGQGGTASAFNGGAPGGSTSGSGGGGRGGASDVREGGDKLADRVVVAGGTGNGGLGGGGVGGTGGGQCYPNGSDGCGGGGGSQSAGGVGGGGGDRNGFARGNQGDPGKGGRGGDGPRGMYTGGGGGGGRGASSFAKRGATHVENKQGAAPSGNGQVVISW